MKKTLLALAACAIVVGLQGCNVGTVTSQQQKDKVDRMEKYVQDHKDDGPPRQERPN
jgi:hypothetical protein